MKKVFNLTYYRFFEYIIKIDINDIIIFKN